MTNLATKLKEELKSEGLESLGLFYSFYRGTVSDNEDPLFLGRLKIECPQVYGLGVSPDKWAPGKGLFAGKQSGMYWIPSPGDPVYISFEGGNPRYPVWEYGWWLEGNTPDDVKVKGNQVYALQTPGGARIYLDDSSDKVTIKNKAGFVVELSDKGISVKGEGTKSLKEVLSEMNQEVAKLTVSTPLGPSGIPINSTKFTGLVSEISKFLV